MPGPLAAKVRAKFPGAYDDLDDAALEKAVLSKHPEYADLAQPEKPKTPAESGALSKASDFLPTVGGAIGGMAGGIPGAALGGAAGEGYRSLINHATELPGAFMDVARNVAGGHGLATLKGFNEGATEGGIGAATEGAIQGALTGAVGLAGKAISKAPGLVVGGLRMAGVPIPSAVGRIVGMLPRGAKAAAQVAEHTPTAAGYETAQQAMARPLRIVAPAGSMAEHAAATPAAEAAVNAERAGTIKPEAWGDWGGAEKHLPTLGLDASGSTVSKAELPQAWRQFVKPEGASVPRGTATPAKALTIKDFGGLSSWEKDAIRAEQEAHGLKPVIKAHEAADYLAEHGSMIPPGTTASREAQHISNGQMKARYRHLLESEGVDTPMSALLGYLGGGK